MKRAKLVPEEVTRIVVSATMTMPSEDAMNDLLIEHVELIPEQLGCHFLLMMNGDVFTPVADDERSSWFHRYGSTAIIIVIEGGLTDEAQIANNYYPSQKTALRNIVKAMKKKYPNAELTLHHELFLGVNPVLEKSEIEDD